MATLLLDRVRAVFFDLFHTLVEVAPGHWNSSATILGLSDAEWNRRLWQGADARARGLISDPVAIIRSLVADLDPPVEEARIEAAARNRAARFREALLSPAPHRVQVLAAIRARGLITCLVSNADTAEVAAWHESPLAALFDSAYFSCDVGVVKPEPAIFLLGLERHGLEANACLFVGDGGSDELRAARELGFTTVMTTEIVGRLWPELVDERRRHADHEIDDLRGLLRLPAA